LKVDPILVKELKGANFEIPEQFQGMFKFQTFLENNNEMTQFLYNKFKYILFATRPEPKDSHEVVDKKQ
jgi:hypothetical protein